MSSADPSLSLPHQSHTVPPAHSVPYSPSSLPPFRRALPAFPRSPLSPPLARRGPAVSSRRTFRARSPSSCYLARSSPRFRLRGPLSRCFPSRQPAAIDINLRNFFGASTCHRVTAHSQPDVPDAGAEYAGMRLAGVTGGRGASGRGRMRTKEAEGPNHRMVIRGHRAAIFETLIERINRGRAGREAERTRATLFAFYEGRGCPA